MLLIVSGRWWDDWCFYNQPNWVSWNVALQLGRPSVYVILKFAKLLPEQGYRIITFFMFYFCMLFLYITLKNWLSISDRGRFWICALYAVIPANDARIVLAVFPYTVGFFFFMAGMSYLSGIIDHEKLAWKERIISWIFFLLGFLLNSTMCLYAIVLLMIMMKKGIKGFFRYCDFIILPIVYYLIKNHFFPVYGAYAGYNDVTFGRLLKAVCLILPADIRVIMSLIYNDIIVGRPIIAFAVGIVVFIVLNFTRLKELILALVWKEDFKWETDSATGIKENVSILLFGILVLSVGLFPYVTVRQSSQIPTSGVGGARCHISCLWCGNVVICPCLVGTRQ